MTISRIYIRISAHRARTSSARIHAAPRQRVNSRAWVLKKRPRNHDADDGDDDDDDDGATIADDRTAQPRICARRHRARG